MDASGTKLTLVSTLLASSLACIPLSNTGGGGSEPYDTGSRDWASSSFSGSEPGSTAAGTSSGSTSQGGTGSTGSSGTSASTGSGSSGSSGSTLDIGPTTTTPEGGRPRVDTSQCATLSSAVPDATSPRMTQIGLDVGHGDDTCAMQDIRYSGHTAVLNRFELKNSQLCGSCIRVEGPVGWAVVQIVDACPSCGQGQMQLSSDVFDVVTGLDQGSEMGDWYQVPCDESTPIEYRFHHGSSEGWTAIQIRDALYPVKTLEARGADGRWKTLNRAHWNHFVAEHGIGRGPYTFRLTDTRGAVVEDTGVPLSPGSAWRSGFQFPECN